VISHFGDAGLTQADAIHTYQASSKRVLSVEYIYLFGVGVPVSMRASIRACGMCVGVFSVVYLYLSVPDVCASVCLLVSVRSLDSRGFHPLASDLLVAVTGDNEIKLYDVASGNRPPSLSLSMCQFVLRVCMRL
jgi:hypothetical protein